METLINREVFGDYWGEWKRWYSMVIDCHQLEIKRYCERKSLKIDEKNKL